MGAGHRPGGVRLDRTADAHEDNVFAFLRFDADGSPLLAVTNFSPVVRHAYRLGVPDTVPAWREVLNTDDARYGGSGVLNPAPLKAEPTPGTRPPGPSPAGPPRRWPRSGCARPDHLTADGCRTLPRNCRTPAEQIRPHVAMARSLVAPGAPGPGRPRLPCT